MVSNFWNDHEEDMERTAIDHYLDDLDTNDILLRYVELMKRRTISREALMGIIRFDLREYYDVATNNEGNIDYLEREFNERVNAIAINLGKDVR